MSIAGYKKISSEGLWFILDENKDVIPATIMEWGKFLEETQHRIVKQEIVNGFNVSTVFVGIDHNLMGDVPHLFETMIFDKSEHDIYCDRYSTWQEAEEGHKKAIKWVEGGCNNE